MHKTRWVLAGFIYSFSIKKLLLVFLLSVYLILLITNIGDIYLAIGDERRYKESVLALLDGYIDTNNHPLLAKTIWLFFVSFFYIISGTDLAIFWRFASILFLLFSLILFYRICRFFFSARVSLISTFILALDPLYFVFGRILMLDIFASFFSLFSLFELLLYLKSRKNLNLFASALALGLSLAVKYSALFLVLLIPIFLFCFVKKTAKIGIPVIAGYVLFTGLGILLGNFIYLFYDHNLINFLNYFILIFKSQFGLITENGRLQTSSAISWFIVPQIITLYRIDLISKVETIVGLQNPAMFFVSLFTILKTALLVFRKNSKINYKVILVFTYFLGQYLPWFFDLHDTYYFYILPLIPLIIILFINILVRYKNHLNYLKIFLAINFLFFIIFYPLLVGITLPKAYDLLLYKYSLYKYPEINSLFCQSCFPRK